MLDIAQLIIKKCLSLAEYESCRMASASTWQSVTISAVRVSLSGSNSVVECQLPKLDVAGSIPVSRSK
jgi:hypothetical protein